MEDLVQRAKEGSPEALEGIINAIQDKVYHMALRMLGHPEDARDDTQEILIKVIKNIREFRGESRFMTWVYRIAANQLLTTRKRRAEHLQLNFELLSDAIEPFEGYKMECSTMHPEKRLMEEEMKHTCVLGTLLCLSREVRLAFILKDVFEVSSDEGAYILEITPVAFRKRASRGRGSIRNFMLKNCGYVKDDNPCNCARQIISDTRRGWVDPAHPIYAGKTGRRDFVEERFFEDLDEVGRIVALYKNYPSHPTPDIFMETFKSLIKEKS